MKCPKCQQTERQVKSGRTGTGSQRYKCQFCGHRYTPEPKAQGSSDEIRLRAVQLYVDGGNLRRVARQLGVNHQSIAKWVNAHAAQLPDAPCPTRSRRLRWTNCIPLSSAKKQSLYHDLCGSNDSLRAGLGSRLAGQ